MVGGRLASPSGGYREVTMDDGSQLLTGPGAGPVLSAAVQHAGGELLSWKLEHVDANPSQSTTATYLAQVK